MRILGKVRKLVRETFRFLSEFSLVKVGYLWEVDKSNGVIGMRWGLWP
jgi:hypothetical protein